jgi:hypothetical protein
MAEGIETSDVAADEFVEFWTAGQTVKGEFHCSDCGYGVTIVRTLPLCPMCGCTTWEQTPWSPFTRSHQAL